MTKRTVAEFYLFVCTFIWGGTFVIVKQGLDDASPLMFIAVRFGIASVLFLLFAFRHLKKITSKAILHGSILGFLLWVGFATQTIGLQYTTASKSGFITGLLVIFTPLFQILIERRPPKTGNILGIILVVVGLYLLTSPGGSSFNIGDGLTLICAAVFGLYIVYLDLFSKESSFWQLAFMQFVLTALLSTIASPFFEVPTFVLTGDLLIGLAYLAILATILTLTLQTRYQKDTTPTRAAVIFSLEPVVAAAVAYFALGETIGNLGIIGGFLIVSGLLISELSDRIFGAKGKAPE
ncbi:MAG: DMT family transporter [Ignavibacteria bacterium]|nr:DMT family transporter [Ignavibacteria bacterium]